jgi:hypothetical protein
MQLVIENGGQRPAWIQAYDYSGGPAWYGISDAEGPLTLDNSCGPCLCDEDACPVCDVGPPQVSILLPGETVEWTWTGRLYKTVDGPAGRCGVEAQAAGQYTVSLCRGDRFEAVDFGDLLVGEVCEQHTVTFGATSEVRTVAIPNDPGSSPTVFTLDNVSNSSVLVQTMESCWSDHPWVSVLQNGMPLAVDGDCLCDCTDGRGCEGTWTCENSLPSLPGQLAARLCWGSGLTTENGGQAVPGETCTDVPFDLGAAEVRHVLTD